MSNTIETVEQKLARLEAENAALKSSVNDNDPNTESEGMPTALSFKVSVKGAISVYGLNYIYPVTLYPDQWQRLFERQTDLNNFIVTNLKACEKIQADRVKEREEKRALSAEKAKAKYERLSGKRIYSKRASK